jgi:integrase
MPLLVKHILRHSSGRLSYRRYFALKLRPFIPGSPAHLKKSLGLPDSPGFLGRYTAADDEYAKVVARAQKVLAGAYDRLDAPMLAYLGKLFETRWLEREEAERREGRDGWAALIEGGWDEWLDEFRRWYAEGDREEAVAFWGNDGRQLLLEQSIDLDPSDDNAFSLLCLELNEAALRVSAVSRARLSGQLVVNPEIHAAPSKRVAAPAAPYVPLLSTFDAYAASVGMTPRIRKEGRNYIAKLITFLGHDDAARITSREVGAWRDQLLVEPAQRGGQRSPVTVNDKYLATLKAMLGWAAKKGRELLPENVAAGIRAEVPKRSKLRERHFSDSEAKAILAASLVPAPPKMAPGNRLARRWVPWLCAYTGARVGEIAQLRVQDVQQVDGIWTLRITPDAGPVKNKEYRVVPLHEHLIAQGFLAIVEAAENGAIFYDATMRRSDEDHNRHIDKVGEKLAKWVRDDVGIKDRGVKPSHAWRNLFKTIAVDLGVLPRVSDAITGHALPRGEVGRTYEGPFLKTCAEAIGRFPRFEVEGV